MRDADGLVALSSKGPAVIQAEAARSDPERVEEVAQDSFATRRGVALKAGTPARVDVDQVDPDLIFEVQVPRSGRYVVSTHAAVDEQGKAMMQQARSKYDSLFLRIAAGNGRPTRRVVFVPWSRPESCRQTLGKFDLAEGEQTIQVWLPEGVRLDYIEIRPYVPPEVPEAAAGYQPLVVPPPTRPRLWVNEESLPRIRANLTRGENAPVWERVRAAAAEPFGFEPEPGKEIGHDADLEKAAVFKAFVYLMEGREDLGREAVALIRKYIAAVEFGNLLDITREIGRALYSASLVYDWCYGLMTPGDREQIRRHLMRLADDMEIGWPPFKQPIVNGHGNEAQLNRDLLSMAIAVYDEDPVPYQYCAYRVLEELVPMRRFEYQSPRHNQGVSYGPYRYGWDLHAAWLFYRMTGKRVFDDNIAGVYRFWIYMRLPNGESLRDGDGFSDGRPVHLGQVPLLSYAYSQDPIVKHDAGRQGGMDADPVLFLLLNDPDLKAADGFDELPLSCDFGPVLGSMVARTGWRMEPDSSDVVVEMKGGGYHFANHQHSDAGSFQIYYRGLLAADLGQYHFYGTPYDYNFSKRSVSHSMMLVVDPDERFEGTISNDGGTRFVRTTPTTPEQVRTDPTFANGQVVSADFGPSPKRPFYSYFSVDLTSAYSRKIERYVRSFCFLNLDDDQTPAALIVFDDVIAARPEFRKYWQVNTLEPPEPAEDGVVLRNSEFGRTSEVRLRMLRPEPREWDLRILSGRDVHTVSGQYFEPPKPDRPEANGHRVLFSPAAAQRRDRFLAVLAIADAQAPDLPVALEERSESLVLTLPGRMVLLSRTSRLLEQEMEVEVQEEGETQLLLAGLAPGAWSLCAKEGEIRYNAKVEPGRNTAFFLLPAGRYLVRPQALPGAIRFQVPPEYEPGIEREGA